MKTTLRFLAVSIAVLLAGLPAAAKGGKGTSKPGAVGGPQANPPGAIKGAPVKNDKAAKEEEEKPVNALAKLLLDEKLGPVVRESAAKRIGDFLLGGDGGKSSFVSKESRAGGADKRLKALAKTWVEQTFKSDAYKGKAPVAELYYVLGEEGKLPDWAANHPVLKANMGGFDRDKLVASMAGYTAGEKKAGQRGTGQFSDTAKPEDWAFGFYNDAAEQANTIISDRRTKDQKVSDVTKIEEKPSVPEGPGQKVPAGQSTGFDLVSLFETGAIVHNTYQEGDPTSRKISMKMHTTKDKDGVYDDIAICDITYPTDVFCRTFRVNGNGGSQTFALDDRQPGMRQYTLSMTPERSGDMKITFGRPNNKDQFGITSQGLSKLRAEQAVQTGNIRTVNGQDYYVLGQSAATGDLLFFPASIKGKLNGKGGEKLSPELLATVVSIKDGRPMVAQKPDLGNVRGKDYHLRFNPDLGYYEVAEGKGEPPISTGDPEKPGGGGEGGKPEGGKPGGGADPPTGNPDGGLIKDGEYELDTDLNNALSAELKAKIKIYKITAKGIEAIKGDPQAAMKKFILVFPPEMISRRYIFANYLKDSKEYGGIRVVHGQYLASESDQGTLYADLTRKEKDSNGNDIPLVVGYSVKEGNHVQKLSVKILLSDAMERAGFKPDEIKAAKENLDKVVGAEEKLSITGNRPEETMIVTFAGKAVKFWKTIGEAKPDPGQGGHSGTTGTSSGSTAFDGAQGGQPDDFQDEAEVGPPIEKIKVFKGLKKSHAVLYVNGVEKGKGTNEKPRKWYVMFNFMNQKKIYRTKFVEIMAEGSKDVFDFPYASEGSLDINGDGLTKHANQTSLTDAAILRPVAGSKPDATRGVYAGFASRAEQVKDKKLNCLGPVLWWGMTQGEAQKACEKDSY